MSAYSQASLPGGADLRLPKLDYLLLTAAIALLCFGLIMVASASMSIADRNTGAPFHYVIRHLIALGLALVLSLLMFKISMKQWERSSTILYFVGLLMLAVVLIPGVGTTVNGATRWIRIGGFSLQTSEFMKLFLVIYMAGYVVRRQEELSYQLKGFIKPLILLLLAVFFIMEQPDFGTTAVLISVAMGMLFLGGVPLHQYAGLLGLVGAMLTAFVMSSAYRMERLEVFFSSPWADPFGSGYQLIQALIAFGQGEWFGVGLGNGIMKQYYLPEAHTDFLMAVIGEEFGLVGTVVVIVLFVLIVWRAFRIGALAERFGERFSAFVAYGFGLWIGMQAFINIGVNIGLLPTKGLTLPLMSYGGNSIIVACLAITLLLRIDYELRSGKRGAEWDKE
ncbi:MAG: putative lipid II flippase FtsW [Candidatus Polarisedimenticolaceae bacterium]|nr:putative lipid II flippase FtsW [Candidatus Polarisedimenticolaceae bacterium]